MGRVEWLRQHCVYKCYLQTSLLTITAQTDTTFYCFYVSTFQLCVYVYTWLLNFCLLRIGFVGSYVLNHSTSTKSLFEGNHDSCYTAMCFCNPHEWIIIVERDYIFSIMFTNTKWCDFVDFDNCILIRKRLTVEVWLCYRVDVFVFYAIIFCLWFTCLFPLLSVPEKYAQVQQNPILPPAPFFLWCKNTKKVSLRNWITRSSCGGGGELHLYISFVFCLV